MPDDLLSQLKDLVQQVDDGSSSCPPSCSPCPAPCCPPPCISPSFPFAQVIMRDPPPIAAPTSPKPVKPLQLPCPPLPCPHKKRDPELDYKNRYSHFYNNYNVDFHKKSSSSMKKDALSSKQSKKHCEDYTKRDKGDKSSCPEPGCPTGFKPCTMKLAPPPLCDPHGIWCATVQPCPPKPKKPYSTTYLPEKCTRPCCKHWKSKEKPCLYDAPCRAHCYDHPPGIKPSRSY